MNFTMLGASIFPAIETFFWRMYPTQSISQVVYREDYMGKSNGRRPPPDNKSSLRL